MPTPPAPLLEQAWAGSATEDADHLLWLELLASNDLHEDESGSGLAAPGPVVWAIPGVELPRVPEPSPFAALREAISGLTALGVPAGTVGAELREQTAELLALSHELRVLTAGWLAEVQAREVRDLEGYRSVRTWAQHHDPDLAPADVTVGRDLAVWPRLAEAVRTGRVGLTAAGHVARGLRDAARHLDQPDGLIDGLPGTLVLEAVCDNTVSLTAAATLQALGDDDSQLRALEDKVQQLVEELHSGRVRQVDTAEGALVLLAEQLHLTPVAVLKDALAQQLDALVPSVLDDADECAHATRSLTLRQRPDGAGVRLVVDTDTATGELLFTVLSAAAAQDPANPSDTAAWAQARQDGSSLDGLLDAAAGLTGLTGLDAPRTRDARRHDALVRVLQHYLDSGAAGTADKQPVRVTVTVPVSTVEGRPGALPALGASGQHIPARLLRQWWCDATVTAVLLTREWRALGDTHTSRTTTARERQAGRVEHAGRCARDGCCRPDDPLTRLVPHHISSWASTGTTSSHDTVLVCDSLHHDLHHGQTVRLRNGRLLDEHGWVEQAVRQPLG